MPQLLTASRIVFGAAAIVTTIKGQFYISATLITLGSVTDGIDGFVSRRLGVSSAFGAVFDYFADYLCFVVASWILVRGLFSPNINLWLEVSIGFPLVFGAARYARNSLIATGQTKEVRDMPGLATVFFTFLPVAIIFLDLTEFLDQGTFRITFALVVVVFSLLMVAPVRYPRLTKVPGLSPVVLMLLVLMPFLGTRLLAAAMLPLGLSYVLLAPLMTRRLELDRMATFTQEDKIHARVKYAEKVLTLAATGAWIIFSRLNRIRQQPSFIPPWSDKPLLKSWEKTKPRLGWPRTTDSLCPKCEATVVCSCFHLGSRKGASTRRW